MTSLFAVATLCVLAALAIPVVFSAVDALRGRRS
jgi:hypothetical protein